VLPECHDISVMLAAVDASCVVAISVIEEGQHRPRETKNGKFRTAGLVDAKGTLTWCVADNDILSHCNCP